MYNFSCRSSRPFAHGKEGLNSRGLCVSCVTFILTVKKCPRKITMDTSKRTKDLALTLAQNQVVGFINNYLTPRVF